MREANFVFVFPFVQSWGCSDLYFVALMHAETEEIKFDTKELSAAQWMDVRASFFPPASTLIIAHVFSFFPYIHTHRLTNTSVTN